MGQKEILQKRAKVWGLVNKNRTPAGSRGTIRINTGNTWEHESAKFKICWDLAKEGKEFITEAIFHNGKRADILCLDDATVIEILHSETEEEFIEKVKSYPQELEIIPIRTNTIKNLFG